MTGEEKRTQADFWGVSTRTIERWLEKGMQPGSVEYMRNYARGNRVPESVKAKLEKIASGTTSTFSEMEDEAELLAAVSDGGLDPKRDLEGLVAMAAFYQAKWKTAVVSKSKDDVRYYHDLYTKAVESVRKARLLAERLGVELGETVSREGVCLYLENFIWWLLRCNDTAVTDLSKRLTGKDFPEEVAAELEPALVSSVFLMPLTNSLQAVQDDRLSSGVDLPPWWIEAVKTAAERFFELEPGELEIALEGGRDEA